MNIEDIPEPEYNEDNEQPTVEQLFLRTAIEQLTPIQRKVWELHAWDRLTQDEIAKRLGKARTTIETQIHQCENKIKKVYNAQFKAYNLLKSELSFYKELPNTQNGILEYKALKHKTPTRQSEWEK